MVTLLSTAGTMLYNGYFSATSAVKNKVIEQMTEAEREATIDTIISVFKKEQARRHLFIQLFDRVDTIESELDRRRGVIDLNRFLNMQTQNILFGQLDQVTKYDWHNNRYVFWENLAGDHWVIVNDLLYIVNFNNSRGFYYYTEYPSGKVVKLKPTSGEPELRQSYSADEIEELIIE